MLISFARLKTQIFSISGNEFLEFQEFKSLVVGLCKAATLKAHHNRQVVSSQISFETQDLLNKTQIKDFLELTSLMYTYKVFIPSSPISNNNAQHLK